MAKIAHKNPHGVPKLLKLGGCAIKFQTLGLDFPPCMASKVAHKGPHGVLKLLKLGDSPAQTWLTCALTDGEGSNVA